MTAPLEGPRGRAVALRALVHADRPRLHAFINQPDVVRASNAYRPISEVEQDGWWERATTDPTAAWFAIDDVRGASAELVGTCSLVGIEPVARHAELRIRIGRPERWGQGLGGEACALLLAFAFRDLNLERVWLRVHAEHAAARRLYERLGFVTEGRLRAHGRIAGAPADVVLMGLLRDEWAAAGPNAR
jgi:RimJ/RimL family protein N-acetyltransferase